jgi:hypothetical protein
MLRDLPAADEADVTSTSAVSEATRNATLDLDTPGHHGPTRLTPARLIKKPFLELTTVHLTPERRDRQRKRPTVTRLP